MYKFGNLFHFCIEFRFIFWRWFFLNRNCFFCVWHILWIIKGKKRSFAFGLLLRSLKILMSTLKSWCSRVWKLWNGAKAHKHFCRWCEWSLLDKKNDDEQRKTVVQICEILKIRNFFFGYNIKNQKCSEFLPLFTKRNTLFDNRVKCIMKINRI